MAEQAEAMAMSSNDVSAPGALPLRAVPHAMANALVLPHGIQWHLEWLQGRDLERLQAALPAGWRESIRSATRLAGLPNSLGDTGVLETQFEEIVAEARRLDAEGKLESDRYRKELAKQGDALLERVAQARNLYEEIKRVAEAEREPRRLAGH